MIPPRFTDLRAMAIELEKHSNYNKLGHAIRKALMAQSCLADLRQSSDCCKALGYLLKNAKAIDDIERGAIESALLANAVVLYARATATGGKMGERGAIQIVAKLSLSEKDDHIVLINIRNRALAHVYSAEPIAGELWHEQLMFAVETEGQGWRPASASRRVQFNRPTLERLERQLPVALSFMMEKSRRRIDAVTDMLNDKPVPLSIFEAYQFDPLERFGSSSTVQRILDGQVSGEASALTP